MSFEIQDEFSADRIIIRVVEVVTVLNYRGKIDESSRNLPEFFMQFNMEMRKNLFSSIMNKYMLI